MGCLHGCSSSTASRNQFASQNIKSLVFKDFVGNYSQPRLTSFLLQFGQCNRANVRYVMFSSCFKHKTCFLLRIARFWRLWSFYMGVRQGPFLNLNYEWIWLPIEGEIGYFSWNRCRCRWTCKIWYERFETRCNHGLISIVQRVSVERVFLFVFCSNWGGLKLRKIRVVTA